MNRFKNIDFIIEDFSKKLNAKLTKDRPDYPKALRTFEERRIDWIHNDINKAIIIQPNFEETGVNQNLWNFINIAFYDDGESIFPLKWNKNLVEEKDFSVIENGIQKLLSDSMKVEVSVNVKFRLE